MWFGNPCLRPRLQANQAQGFHYPSLPKFQGFTIDFQGINEPLQSRDYLPSLFTPSVSHTCTLTI